MNIEKKVQLVLLIAVFIAIWFESDFVSAVSRFMFIIYLLIGWVLTIRTLACGIAYFSENKFIVSLCSICLIGYATYWLVILGVNRQAIILVSPFLFGLVLFYTIKICKRLIYAPRT